MQPAGLALTQAGRLVLIVLVIQLLGLRPVVPVVVEPGFQQDAAPAGLPGPLPPDRALPSPLARGSGSRPGVSGPVETPSPPPLPASVPLVRRLSRAPPLA